MGYADDVTHSRFFSTDEDLAALTTDLRAISDWIEKHGFKLNTDKVISRMKKINTLIPILN